MKTVEEQAVGPRPAHVLLLEDDAADALLIEEALTQQLPQASVRRAATRAEYEQQLQQPPITLVLSDGSVPGCEGLEAFFLAREHAPRVPFLFITGSGQNPDLRALHALGIEGFLSKDALDAIGPVLEDALQRRRPWIDADRLLAGYETLLDTVRALAAATDPAALMELGCAAARALTGADGAAFLLREGTRAPSCRCAAVDPVDELRLGRRVPLDDCAAGLAIRQRLPIVLDDITIDPRASRSGSARSSISVPVRPARPIAAIEVFWALPRSCDSTEVQLLQCLADVCTDAMARIEREQGLEGTARERGEELESLSYAISHDLRAPIRHLDGFTRILLLDAPDLSADTRHNVQRIQDAGGRLRDMVNGLLSLSRTSRAELHRQPLDLAELARQIVASMTVTIASAVDDSGAREPRPVEFVAPASLMVDADPRLLQGVLQQLLDNAWKFTTGTAAARVELGVEPGENDGPPAYFVRDNGVGFETASIDRLFGVFQRLHRPEDFPGLGIGLATTKRIIAKHGGAVWATGAPDQGATIFFTLPSPDQI